MATWTYEISLQVLKILKLCCDYFDNGVAAKDAIYYMYMYVTICNNGDLFMCEDIMFPLESSPGISFIWCLYNKICYYISMWDLFKSTRTSRVFLKNPKCLYINSKMYEEQVFYFF